MTDVPFERTLHERRGRPLDPWLTVAGWTWTTYVLSLAAAVLWRVF